MIELIETNASSTGSTFHSKFKVSNVCISTGWAARLGPGASWADVLARLPPDTWTLVHGQCLGVGVGGFTLGGGVNMVGSTARSEKILLL